MAEWTYYAGKIASLEAGLDLARRFGVMWRGARNERGALIANVGRLQPGHKLHFAYREPGRARYVFRAVIGPPRSPAPGAPAIDRIGGPAAEELRRAGYEYSAPGVMEVVHLLDMEELDPPAFVALPAGMNAVWTGPPTILDETGRAAATEKPVETVRRSTGGKTGRSRAAVQPPPRSDRRIPSLPDRGPAMFDRYLAVDWSASSKPARGGDSIWIAEGGWSADRTWNERDPLNCATRIEALAHLEARLTFFGRTLVGFDFAFGYPAGFARFLPGGGEPWLRTAEYLARTIEDSPRNANNRHAVAAEINRRAGSPPGPFWGCHESAASEHLTPRRVGIFQYPFLGLEEYRITDRRVREAGTPLLSVWKIDQGVSVGGQTLMGIPYLMKLRTALRGRGRPFAIWPFETGWAPAADGVTVVEMFPSLIVRDVPSGEIRDRHQVRGCVHHFGRLDAAGELMPELARPAGLDDSTEAQVRTEEGWIILA